MERKQTSPTAEETHFKCFLDSKALNSKFEVLSANSTPIQENLKLLK